MVEVNLNQPKKVHFIGVCGKGMGAVAVMLSRIGWEVTGSDQGFYDPIASYLKKSNINVMTGHLPKNIPEQVNLIVIGRHAKLTPEKNPEVAYAFELAEQKKVTIMSFPEVLSLFLGKTRNLIVAGSYGKSTSTALAIHILNQAGKKPSYFLGGETPTLPLSAKLDEGDFFVLEGDEYPSAHFDERSKFLWYKPFSVLFTSGEHDHFNFFPTLESYLRPYLDLVNLIPNDGSLVFCLDNPHTLEVANNFSGTKISYGENPQADYYFFDQKHDGLNLFKIKNPDGEDLEVKTTELGKHNAQNITGVYAWLRVNTDLSNQEIISGISSFRGVGDRLERVNSKSNEVPVYKSYGSSFSKARSSIEALMSAYPDKTQIVLFEPHTFSWQDRLASDWYLKVFSNLESVAILMPPSEHGKSASNQLNAEEIISLIKSGKNPPKSLVTLSSPEQVFSWLETQPKNNIVINMITSGNLSGLTEELPKHYN